MAVALDSTKVQIGEVDIFVATVPANTGARDALIPAAGSTFAATAGWTRLGALREGINLNQNVDDYSVQADVNIGDIVIVPLRMMVEITGEIVEIVMVNIASLSGMGEATVVGATPARVTKQIGPDVPVYSYKAFAYEGNDQQGFYERGMLWQCRVSINGARRRLRAEEERIPFSAKSMQRSDLAAAGSGYGVFGFEVKKTGA